jgi:putative radical SAM enzyme (TIGR03279 family)
MLKIESVVPGSYAEEIGVQPGDRILTINDQPIVDLLDYHLNIETEHLRMELLCANDELWDLDIEKGLMDDPGIEVEHPVVRTCGNQCQFCFVHQLPKGMRKTLYVKDEDYRFSYLYGSYITTSNLDERDIERIIDKQLSPLYISVHATDERVRSELLRSNPPAIMPLLERLTKNGITLHTQVVLCPGINDGQVLQQTIDDLAELYPQVATLAVVPVGLTRFREKLAPLVPFDSASAGACIEQIHASQQRLLETCGSRFVFAADEFYQQAEQPFPELEAYEELAQIENGVGMVAQFRAQIEMVLADAQPLELDRVTLITGLSFYGELDAFCQRLTERCKTQIDVVAIKNDFFGPRVTVAGLTTGTDIIAQLKGRDLGAALLLPEVMLKEDEQVLIDDKSLDDLSRVLQIPIVVVENSPWGVLDALDMIDLDSVILPD